MEKLVKNTIINIPIAGLTSPLDPLELELAYYFRTQIIFITLFFGGISVLLIGLPTRASHHATPYCCSNGLPFLS